MSTVQERTETAAEALADEIDWLRSFGWPKDRIARRLSVSLSCVEKHIAAKERP